MENNSSCVQTSVSSELIRFPIDTFYIKKSMIIYNTNNRVHNSTLSDMLESQLEVLLSPGWFPSPFHCSE